MPDQTETPGRAAEATQDLIVRWSEVQEGDLVLIDDCLIIAKRVSIYDAPWGDGTTFPQVYVRHALDNGVDVEDERHGDRFTAVRRAASGTAGQEHTEVAAVTGQDAVTPGRAACEAWWTTAGLAGHPEYMGHDAEYRNSRASWDAAAQAVLNQAFPGLRREVDEARAELRSIAAELKSWPRCPDGCGCRPGTDDADRHDCGCDGPCTAECRENGYPDAPSYRDIAIRELRAALSSLADRAEASRAITADEAGEYRKLAGLEADRG